MVKIPNVLLELSFLSLGAKCLYSGLGLPEAVVLTSLVISMSYNSYLAKRKHEDKEEIMNKINELEAKTTEKQAELERRVSNIKSDQIQRAEKLNEKKSITIDPAKRLF